MFPFALLKNWKLIAGIGIILALITVFGVMKYKISSLTSDVQQLETENTSLRKDIDTVTKINKNNQQIIETLKEEQKDRERIIFEYRKTLQNQSRKLSSLNKYINGIKTEDNGPIAPVLLNTIDTIQQMQKEKK